MSRRLLLEIGMEECPARFVPPALAGLERELAGALEAARIAHGEIRLFGTPRRLAALVEDVSDRQSEQVHEVKGPPAQAAFDEGGAPTQAALGFARAQGVDPADLEVRETPAGRYVFARKREAGTETFPLLPDLLSGVIRKIPFGKTMQWNGTIRFARPIRWLVALWDDEPVPFEIAGVRSGRQSRGHRFLAPGPVEIQSAGEYVSALEAASVIVEIDRRRQMICRQAEDAAREAGGRIADDGGLLEEITFLVEYPTALAGRFDEDYLDLPDEVLVTPMREHQRYFPVISPEGKLLARFVAVRNGDSRSLERVRAGNEKVLAARLADARFFFDEDRKRPLAEHAEKLSGVVFQERLGTMAEKAERVGRLAEWIAQELRLDQGVRERAVQAAALCKADLVTSMVYEFPELQGVMGREYALLEGVDERVARAIFEHYLPRFAEDSLPETEEGALLSVADKIDSIVGCFAIGLIPTGSQDPYALRRQAIGILHILLQREWGLSLKRLIDEALARYQSHLQAEAETAGRVLDFFSGRLRTILVEQGLRPDAVDAALAIELESAGAARRRAEALARAVGAPWIEDLMTAYERIAGLASKADSGGELDPGLFQVEEEKRLWSACQRAAGAVEAHVEAGDFSRALESLAALREPVDAFFEAVMVMDKDLRIRANRLLLLVAIDALFQTVGDLRKLQLA